MTEPAPPVSPEAPDPPPGRRLAGSAVAAASLQGLLAFAITAGVGIAIGLAEYAATKGAYRPWTWIKVGFLYLLSFCGVTLRATSVDASVPVATLDFRLPMMVGTGLAVWLLFRGGRKAADATSGREGGAKTAWVAVAAMTLSFVVPTFLVSLPSTLRFPEFNASISPVAWQSAVFPFLLAAGASSAGALWGWPFATTRPGTLRAIAAGGWTMFAAGLGLALVAFLVLAALKPTQTGRYAAYVRDRGRAGAVVSVHHVLFLPDQSVWILGPAMGGSTTITFVGGEPGVSTVVRMSGIEAGEYAPGHRLPLGGGFYLFGLVPLIAVVAGGRVAAEGAASAGSRALRGAGAGVAFAVLMGIAARFSASTIPTGLGTLPVSIHADMPSTALLALAWGVLGGALGALTSGIGAQPGTPVPDPG